MPRPPSAGRAAFFFSADVVTTLLPPTNERVPVVTSGVYFYEVRAAGEKRIGKLTLVR
jgi:hypothetical protein